MSIAFVIVSHSAEWPGVVELAQQMAKDVEFRAAGGTEDGGIGTSFDLIYAAVEELTGAGHQVVLLTDLWARPTTTWGRSVLEMVDPEQVHWCPGPAGRRCGVGRGDRPGRRRHPDGARGRKGEGVVRLSPR